MVGDKRGEGKTMDDIPQLRNVMFVGDYFSLMTTVHIIDDLRLPGESDDDLAVRVANSMLKEIYGWDVASASLEIGVTED